MRAIFCFLSTILFLMAGPRPAQADDWSECKAAGLDARIAACSRIIEKGERDPKDLAAARRYRSSAYYRRRDQDKAIEDLNQAIRLDPENAAFFRGHIRLAEKDFDAAIALFSEAIQARPDNSEFYSSRGVAYARKGDQERALANYDAAVRLDPTSVVALNNRGSAYRNKGELEKALADLNEATRLQPNYPLPYYNRALLLERKEDIDAALAECNKAIQLDPKYVEALTERANLYGYKNDFDRVIADASAATELDPQLINAYNVRARAYGSKGELDKALADFNSAIQINPKLPYLYNNRANTYFGKNILDRAIVDYDFAIQLNDKNPLYYYNRGKVYDKKNNSDRALADYRKVLDLPAVSSTDTQRQEVVRQRIARLTQTSRSAAPAPAPPVPPVKRVALVIGNAKYSSVGTLTNPPNDAKAIAESLRRLGFGYVMEVYDLSHEKMVRALKEFGDRAENAEWAVVFYAGHGIEMNGVSYLIPTDAELLRDTHVADETVSLTQVQAKVDAAAKLGLIILDSCRNNPFLARMVRAGGGARAIGRGLASVEPEGNVLVAYSAKHGTTASDGDSANSPFTEALLTHIEEPGLEINFLFRKVRDDVRSKTRRQQEPFLYGSLSSEPLYFKEVAHQ